MRTCALLCLFLASAAAVAQVPSAPPVNPDATPAARALLREIDGVSGHATLSGQHNFPNSVSRYSDRVYDLTGAYPAIFGQDFGFSGGDDKDSTLGRPDMIQEVIRQYRAGAVIALTWHAVRPTDDEPVTFRDSVQGHLTDWEWHQVLTPGTDLYNRWCRQVDVVAGYLSELQNAGVPVLFRGYHEMNGNWFWWGGRPGPDGSAALYRQLFNRFVHVHHLNNLIWVWNVNSPSGNAGSIDAYYPGAGYADVLTMDIYGPFEQSYYDSMVALAGPDHPIALAEVGAMPTLDVLAHQPRWAYFMMWSGMAEFANTPQQLATMFHAPNVIDRGDPRLPAPLPAPATAPLPVTADATAAAKELLARLYSLQGKSILAGEQQAIGVIPQPSPTGARAAEKTSPMASANEPLPATFAANAAAPEKRSALAEITFDDPGSAQLRTAIRNAAKAGQVVLLRWMPPRPTGDEIPGGLTDFEWQQLITPGTDLNKRWQSQADAVATLLKDIENDHIAVLWSAYPQSNLVAAVETGRRPGAQADTRAFWWSGRPGPEGSRALIRMLFERLVQHDQIRNLIWVWEPAMPGFGPNGNGQLADYYPGGLYYDAFSLDVPALTAGRFRADRMVERFAGGKPMGVRVASGIPAPAVIDEQTGWQWLILDTADGGAASARQALYADPKVLALPNSR